MARDIILHLIFGLSGNKCRQKIILFVIRGFKIMKGEKYSRVLPNCNVSTLMPTFPTGDNLLWAKTATFLDVVFYNIAQ